MKRFEKSKGKVVDESNINDEDVEANNNDDDDVILSAMRSPEKANDNDNSSSTITTSVTNFSIPSLIEQCNPATQYISNTINTYLPSERRADLSNRFVDFAWVAQGRVANFSLFALQAAGTGLGLVSEVVWSRLDPLLQRIIDNLDLGSNEDGEDNNNNNNSNNNNADRSPIQQTPRESLEP